MSLSQNRSPDAQATQTSTKTSDFHQPGKLIVAKHAKAIRSSHRGELEITDSTTRIYSEANDTAKLLNAAPHGAIPALIKRCQTQAVLFAPLKNVRE